MGPHTLHPSCLLFFAFPCNVILLKDFDAYLVGFGVGMFAIDCRPTSVFPGPTYIILVIASSSHWSRSAAILSTLNGGRSLVSMTLSRQTSAVSLRISMSTVRVGYQPNIMGVKHVDDSCLDVLHADTRIVPLLPLDSRKLDQHVWRIWLNLSSRPFAYRKKEVGYYFMKA